METLLETVRQYEQRLNRILKSVALEKPVAAVAQADLVLGHLVRHHRFGVGEAVPVAGAEYLAGHHELVSAQLRVARVGLREDVDQLDHPVAEASITK